METNTCIVSVTCLSDYWCDPTLPILSLKLSISVVMASIKSTGYTLRTNHVIQADAEEHTHPYLKTLEYTSKNRTFDVRIRFTSLFRVPDKCVLSGLPIRKFGVHSLRGPGRMSTPDDPTKIRDEYTNVKASTNLPSNYIQSPSRYKHLNSFAEDLGCQLVHKTVHSFHGNLVVATQ